MAVHAVNTWAITDDAMTSMTERSLNSRRPSRDRRLGLILVLAGLASIVLAVVLYLATIILDRPDVDFLERRVLAMSEPIVLFGIAITLLGAWLLVRNGGGARRRGSATTSKGADHEQPLS